MEKRLRNAIDDLYIMSCTYIRNKGKSNLYSAEIFETNFKETFMSSFFEICQVLRPGRGIGFLADLEEIGEKDFPFPLSVAGKKLHGFEVDWLEGLLHVNPDLIYKTLKARFRNCQEVKALLPYLFSAYYLNADSLLEEDLKNKESNYTKDIERFKIEFDISDKNHYRDMRYHANRFSLENDLEKFLGKVHTPNSVEEYILLLEKVKVLKENEPCTINKYQYECVRKTFVFMVMVLLSIQHEELLSTIDYCASFELFYKHTLAFHTQYISLYDYILEDDPELCVYNMMKNFFSKDNYYNIELEIESIQEKLKELNLGHISLAVLEQLEECPRRLILIAAQIICELHPDKYMYWKTF